MHDEYQPAEDAHAPVGDDRKTGRGRAQQRRSTRRPSLNSLRVACLVCGRERRLRGGCSGAPRGRWGTRGAEPSRDHQSTAVRARAGSRGRPPGAFLGAGQREGGPQISSRKSREGWSLSRCGERVPRAQQGRRGRGGRAGGSAAGRFVSWVSAYLIERGEWEVPALSMSRWELFAPRLIRLPMRGRGQRWGGTSSTG